MRLFYSLILLLLTPYLYVRLWWKSRKNAHYTQRIGERFGLKEAHQDFDIWLHAVSLGESIAVTPLIELLLADNLRILVTTTTPSGENYIRHRFKDRVTHRYLPYDLTFAVKGFLRNFSFRAGLIMETELWPNLLHYVHKKGIPLLLINARLSKRSFASYHRLKFFFQSVLANFTFILAQTQQDRQRFIALGAQSEQVQVPGNIKFDQKTESASSNQTFLELKEKWGKERFVIIAASTHDNEEEQLLKAFLKIKPSIPNCILLIAPRHPERFERVYQYVQQMNVNGGLRSNLNTINPNNEVVVLNSLGELLGFYSISDAAFVGGSLVPIGGHNVLEPVAMKVPVLTGPLLFNFQSICQELVEKNALVIANNADEAMEKILFLYQNPALKEQMVNNAWQMLQENKGALLKYKRKVDEALFVQDVPNTAIP